MRIPITNFTSKGKTITLVFVVRLALKVEEKTIIIGIRATKATDAANIDAYRSDVEYVDGT